MTKSWRTDGIKPTYSTGESFAWIIDGRFELEMETAIPIVAWVELVSPRHPLLGTFQMVESGGMGRFAVFRLGEPDPATGRTVATSAGPDVTRKYIPLDENPFSPPGVNASPVLRALHAEAAARSAAAEEEHRLQRQATH